MPNSPVAAGGWEAVGPDRFRLAEGARWSGGRLVFVDLLAGDLYRHRTAARHAERVERLQRLGVPLGAVAPVAGRPGWWIAAAGTGFALVGPGAGPPDWLARPEEAAGTPMRMNDGACDPAGRFWAGSMAADGSPGAGSLHRLDPDGSVHRVLHGLGVPNGPAFSADGTAMYLADSAARTIHRFPLDPGSGALGRPHPMVRFAAGEGRPDGMAVDDAGLLWVAVWGAAEVRAYSAAGALVRTVAVPTPHVSSVAFGGGRMWVTTARHRLRRPDATAGAVLGSPTAVTAPPARPYG
ncbi:SMP-30/gluconolactonase/LRE family protein [Streptomyces sp. NPDC020917]|uniref:SMP-30/gluconolactonase/LRE family protein n=1 Tax=Streptomyces sp. NPDC020917 TaxID=3365102 RepID=UPI0037B4A796